MDSADSLKVAAAMSDIFVAAGGRDEAIVEQFTATANTAGQIVIAFTQAGADNLK